MIRIQVHAKEKPETRVRELCQALQHARIWKVSDRRCTKNLQLIHSSGTVTGTIRRVNPDDPASLQFQCKAKDSAQEAITTGRFVNLVLRDLASVSDITIHRASSGRRPPAPTG